ncbi:hypothetical protein COCON_G00200480, partial [Conger conger]
MVLLLMDTQTTIYKSTNNRVYWIMSVSNRYQVGQRVMDNLIKGRNFPERGAEAGEVGLTRLTSPAPEAQQLRFCTAFHGKPGDGFPTTLTQTWQRQQEDITRIRALATVVVAKGTTAERENGVPAVSCSGGDWS